MQFTLPNERYCCLMKKTIKQTGDLSGDSNRIFASLVTDFGQVTPLLSQLLHLHTGIKRFTYSVESVDIE